MVLSLVGMLYLALPCCLEPILHLAISVKGVASESVANKKAALLE